MSISGVGIFIAFSAELPCARLDRQEAIMAANPVIHLVGSVRSERVPVVRSRLARSRPFMDLLKHLRAGRFARVFLKPAPKADTDPYLLLLLADQELSDGRKEQARHLIDAVYEHFDQKTKVQVSTLPQSNAYKAC